MGENKTKAWPFIGQFKINIPRFKRKENRKKLWKISNLNHFQPKCYQQDKIQPYNLIFLIYKIPTLSLIVHFIIIQ